MFNKKLSVLFLILQKCYEKQNKNVRVKLLVRSKLKSWLLNQALSIVQRKENRIRYFEENSAKALLIMVVNNKGLQSELNTPLNNLVVLTNSSNLEMCKCKSGEQVIAGVYL